MYKPTRRQLLAMGAALTASAEAQAEPEWLARFTAKSYGLLDGEKPEFHAAFSLLQKILPAEERSRVDKAAVTRNIDTLAAAIAANRPPGPEFFNHPEGSPRIEIAPHLQKVVVFSDHHLGAGAHRSNVFSGREGSHFRSSNHALYVAVLEQYAAQKYVLVENGDVEDLVVFDPRLHPGEFQTRLDLVNASADPLSALDAHRAEFRKGLLAETMSDPANRAYYGVLARFDDHGALFRTAGNHDHQRRALWAESMDMALAGARRDGLGELRLPSDRSLVDLFVMRNSMERMTALIMHGHQFDHASCPSNASLHGETISECMGGWYQGADRIWAWEEWCHLWTQGRPFRNILVSGTVPDEAEMKRLARNDGSASYPAWWEARTRLWSDSLLGKTTFEGVFEHPIAWEYLQRDTDQDPNDVIALVGRVALSGDAWFKYRHTEEIELASTLPAKIKAAGGSKGPPLLVLGHTHEPRVGAVDGEGIPVEWYANSGAAGRFEGILWAVEILDGEPCVVSWHADPHPDGPPRRRRWFPGGGEFREELVSIEQDLA